MPAPAIAIARNEPPRLRSVTTRSGSSGLATRRWSATNADQQHDARAEEREGDGIGPAVGLGARHAEHEREQAGGGDERAGDVEPGPRRCRYVVEQPQAADRGRDGEEDRHVQAPAPVEHLGQEAAEQQAEGAAGAGDGAVDAERLGALGGLGERRGEQGERGRGEHRGEHALERAGADEQLEALRGAAERGCTGEAEQAGDERPLAAEQVGDPAAEQQQAAERERVGGDDPLAVVVGEPEVLLGGGERDVDDRHVEHDQQLGDADDDEDQPAAVVMGICRGGMGRTSRMWRAGLRLR